MMITVTEKHEGSGMWRGFATAGDKTYQWYYRPRSMFNVTEAEPSIPGCWMNVDPSAVDKRLVLNAIRKAKQN